MLSDETATPDQIRRHLDRLVRLNTRAEYAEDAATADWTAKAIVRCQDLLHGMRMRALNDT